MSDEINVLAMVIGLTLRRMLFGPRAIEAGMSM